MFVDDFGVRNPWGQGRFSLLLGGLLHIFEVSEVPASEVRH